MKKKEDAGLFERVGPVRLYLDDIERISDTLNEAGLTVTFSDSSHTFASLDEIAPARGERPRRLSIEGERRDGKYGSVKVDIGDTSVWLRENVWLITNGGAEMLRLGYQVKELLRQRIPRRAAAVRPVAWIWTLVIMLNVGVALLRDSALQARVARPFFIVAGIALFLWLAVIVERRLSYGVFLRRRHVGGFFSRNRDQIALLVVGSILGAILGVVGTLITQRLSK